MAWLNRSETEPLAISTTKTTITGAGSEKLRAPFAGALNAAYWARLQKWEDENVKPPGSGHPVSRGEWVNALLDTLLGICDSYGYSPRAGQEQQLRDELFDYVKSVSF